MQTGDIVFSRGNKFEIKGIYLGATGHQNMIGLKSLELGNGYVHGLEISEMYVPEEFVISAGVYRRVDVEG